MKVDNYEARNYAIMNFFIRRIPSLMFSMDVAKEIRI